jgi:hypothetical protein
MYVLDWRNGQSFPLAYHVRNGILIYFEFLITNLSKKPSIFCPFSDQSEV